LIGHQGDRLKKLGRKDLAMLIITERAQKDTEGNNLTL
jgi:hypothetical protein